MNPRRKFLLQGGLASTALLSLNPFQSIANKLSPLTGFNMNSNKVLLVHTCYLENHIINNVADIKRSSGNVVLLHSCETKHWEEKATMFDAFIGQPIKNQHSTGKDYAIVYRGNYKIGIITPSESRYDFENINSLSDFLKKERNCDLIICLSNLGYKNSNEVDDVTLASESTNLDIIIGGHAHNFSKHPVIVFNKNREEVIINHSLSGGVDFGKIEIEFDANRNKRHVAFNYA